MVIIAEGKQHYDVSMYVREIEQLRDLIKEKLTELNGMDVCVR